MGKGGGVEDELPERLMKPPPARGKILKGFKTPGHTTRRNRGVGKSKARRQSE